MNSLEEKIGEFEKALIDYEAFVRGYETEASNRIGVQTYLRYLNDSKIMLNKQFASLDYEQLNTLSGSVAALSRYSGEFNWFKDLSFDFQNREYLNTLFELATSISDSIENRDQKVDQVKYNVDSSFDIVEKFDSGIDYIREFEGEYKLNIPSDYKEFLLRFGGGVPNKNNYYKELISNGVYDFRISAFYGNCEYSRSLDLGFNYVMSLGVIPEGYLPIADDGVGNHICIGTHRENLNRIYLAWDNELEEHFTIEKLENSLSDFMAHLG